MKRIILLLLLVLAIISAQAATQVNVQTVCNEIMTGGGQTVMWKGNVHGGITCKVARIVQTDYEYLCLQQRYSTYSVTFIEKRWIKPDKLICHYRIR